MATFYDYVGGVASKYLRDRDASLTKSDTRGTSETRRVCNLDASGETEVGTTSNLHRQPNVSCAGISGTKHNVMEAGTSSGSALLLGWSSNQTDVLPRKSFDATAGRNPSLFVPGKSDTVALDAQTVKYLKQLGLDDKRISDIEGMTCSRIINHLVYCFDRGDDKVILNGKFTTPMTMLQLLPSLGSVPACHVGPVKFLGGPPDAKKRLQRGSVRTLLLDAIFVAACNEDQSKYQRFLNVRI